MQEWKKHFYNLPHAML